MRTVLDVIGAVLWLIALTFGIDWYNAIKAAETDFGYTLASPALIAFIVTFGMGAMCFGLATLIHKKGQH